MKFKDLIEVSREKFLVDLRIYNDGDL